MTIFNYDKTNISYQSKFLDPPWNKSANSIGVIAIVIATFTAFSSSRFLNKVSPFIFAGVLIQTSIKSKEIEDIKKKTKSNLITINRVESRLDSNDKEIKNLLVKLSKIKAQQEQKLEIDLDTLASKIAEIEVQFESNQVSNDLSLINKKIEHLALEFSKVKMQQEQKLEIDLDSVTAKITQIEAQFDDYLPKSHLAPFRNKFSRLSNQYIKGKLLTPDALLKVDQLEEEVSKLCNIVNDLFKANKKQLAISNSSKTEDQEVVRFPTTNSCGDLPRKKPERPKSDHVGIFVDGTNISISAQEVWNCYPAWDRLLIWLKKESVVCNARYYDSFSENKRTFLTAVKNKGYQVITKPIIERHNGTTKGNLDIEMANDIQACIEHYDTFVIVSCDGDFLDTVRKLRSIGKRVEIVSFFSRTHTPLTESADSYTDLTNLQVEISY